VSYETTMWRPPAASLLTACRQRRLQPENAWAVTIGSAEQPVLWAVRGSLPQAQDAATEMRKERPTARVQVNKVIDLLERPR
jgi:hypothetical protein